MTSSTERTREQRIRRAAKRQGLALRKTRTRDPRALDYGMYALADEQTNVVVAGTASDRFGFSLDDVDAYLNGKR